MPEHIKKLMEQIEKEAKELADMAQENNLQNDMALSRILGFNVRVFSAPKNEPTVQELTLSEALGMPVRIKRHD